MGGVRTFLALVLALACACVPARAEAARAHAARADDVRALAREKAAAVAIMRHKAASQIGTLAQDRLFGAYLNATTQSEGARLKRRIESAFSTVNTRFGLSKVTLLARDGTVVAHVASQHRAVGGDFKNAVLTGFALDAMKVSTLVIANGGRAGFAISHITPVVWRGNTEFVLRGEQDIGAYKAVLKSGVGAGQYVALIDETRSILSDAGTNPDAQSASAKLSVAGLTFDAIRHSIKGAPNEGSGEVTLAKTRFNVGYQSVGPWTIVAVEAAARVRRCPANEARICG